MRILTRRREDEIVAYIEQARIEFEQEIEARDEIIANKDEMLIAAVKEIAHLHDAWKDAVRLQRDVIAACILSRDDPDSDLDFDLHEMLVAVSDQVAQLEEHLP